MVDLPVFVFCEVVKASNFASDVFCHFFGHVHFIVVVLHLTEIDGLVISIYKQIYLCTVHIIAALMMPSSLLGDDTIDF